MHGCNEHFFERERKRHNIPALIPDEHNQNARTKHNTKDMLSTLKNVAMKYWHGHIYGIAEGDYEQRVSE